MAIDEEVQEESGSEETDEFKPRPGWAYFPLGWCMGVVAMSLFSILTPPNMQGINEIRIHEQQGTSIMRLYRDGARDGFYIQDPDDSNRYVPLSNYQDSVSQQYKAATEEQ